MSEILTANEVRALREEGTRTGGISSRPVKICDSHEALRAQRDTILAACTGAEGEPDPLEALKALTGTIRHWINYGMVVPDEEGALGLALGASERLLARLREACEKAKG